MSIVYHKCWITKIIVVFVIVDEIKEAARGGFYRVYDNIRKFVP